MVPLTWLSVLFFVLLIAPGLLRHGRRWTALVVDGQGSNIVHTFGLACGFLRLMVA
jgi:hypothetical protein